MEVKPGYKQTEVGVLPEDWRSVPLSELGKFKNGINKNSEAFGHGHPFVNLMDVFGVSSIATSEALGLIDSNNAEQQTYDLRKGDVIFIRSSVKPSGVGLTAVVEKDLPKTVYSGFLVRFRDGGALSDGFKRHCFYEEGFRKRVIDASSVSANTNINQDSLKRLILPLPPTEAEQEAIAEALSDADALIESLEQLLAKKRQIKQGAMQELLTGKKRLPGFTGEWEVKRLGDVASLYQPTTISAKHFTESGYPVYGANGVVGFYSQLNHETWQVTVTCRGSTCGTVNRTVDRCWITGNAMVLNCDQNQQLNKEFFYHLLCSQDLSDCITGTGQPQIVRAPLAAFEVPHPPTKAEQEAISAILSDMDAEIAALEAKLAKARRIKQGMMQELLTGKIRLV